MIKGGGVDGRSRLTSRGGEVSVKSNPKPDAFTPLYIFPCTYHAHPLLSPTNN